MSYEIIPEQPFEDGVAAGRELGKDSLLARVESLLADPIFAESYGAMDRAELAAVVMARLQTPPDVGAFPELEDLYPERVDYIRGFAEGAGCSLPEAATYQYLTYRHESVRFWLHFQLGGTPAVSHCSGAVLVGPDGILGSHSVESDPIVPKPANYEFRQPPPQAAWAASPPVKFSGVIRKPRTGYITHWGVGNEKGLACFCGTSCGVWLDDPIEDTWPLQNFPIARFAGNIEELVALFQRYTLHIPGHGSMLWGDTSGNAVAIEKSFRRVGARLMGDEQVLWCTEGYWHTPEMSAFLHNKRAEYLQQADLHLGSADMQYFTDCVVRFTRLAEMCHADWGRGYEHMNRILTDHSTFPRAICRHGGPDTAPYDITVTMDSRMVDLTHNRSFHRRWVPWEKFPCELPWTVTQYPEWPRTG